MSGASALAAAKRRRSKVDSSRTPSNTSNNSRSNTNTNTSSSSNMPPRLNVQQSFQYMWQKILQVESMVNNNTTNSFFSMYIPCLKSLIKYNLYMNKWK